MIDVADMSPGATFEMRAVSTPARRRLALTALGFGGAPLGNLGRALSEADADAAVEAAWDCGIRYFDTAPLYGHGLSETRLGRNLRRRPRGEFVLSTKVGRLLEPCAPGDEDSGIYVATPPLRVRFDYTRDGVIRSFEASLRRLGLDRIDVLYVHDLELATQGSRADYETRLHQLLDGGGWRALDDLRSSGAVAAIGLGVNQSEACERLLSLADPDIFLLAGRYTLLEQGPQSSLFPACARRGVAIVAGGPYNSGVLARRGGTFDYAPPAAEVLERVEALDRLCRRFDVPLAMAALQFVAAHPQVVSVIPGGQTTGEVRDNAARFRAPVPSGLWAALKSAGLVDPAAPTPDRLAAC